MATGAMLPVDGVWRAFGAALRLSPMEGDVLAERVCQGMELVLRNIARTAGGVRRRLRKPRIAVNDPELVLSQFADSADFSRQETGRLTWYGKVIPESQRKAMLAEARARLSANGEPADVVDDQPGPHRWVRGELRIDDGELVAEVNSFERLGKLVGLLTKAGAAPRVTDQTRVDPAMNLPWPAKERVHTGGLAPPELGREKYWLDEQAREQSPHLPTRRG